MIKSAQKKFVFLTSSILLVLFIVVFIAIIKLPMFDTITTRMEDFLEIVTGKGQGDASTQTRLDMILDGWNVFKERIVVGYGANNYKNVTRYKVYSHNNFVEILVDFGLIGFALYYLIYFHCFKKLRKGKSDAEKALFSIFLVRFIMEIALVTYYDKLNWIFVAFCLINTKENKFLTDDENK